MAKRNKQNKMVPAVKGKKEGGEKKVGKELVTGVQAAEMLGSSLALVYALKRQKRLNSGVIISKRLYFERKEIEELKATGTIHPRKRHTPLGAGDLANPYTSETNFNVKCSTEAYNILSLALKSSGLSVSEWCAKIILKQAEESQKVSMMGVK